MTCKVGPGKLVGSPVIGFMGTMKRVTLFEDLPLSISWSMVHGMKPDPLAVLGDWNACGPPPDAFTKFACTSTEAFFSARKFVSQVTGWCIRKQSYRFLRYSESPIKNGTF